MALIRWEPAREISSLQSEMNRLFNTFFDAPAGQGNGATLRRWVPAMDLVETDEHFVLRADLPGLSEEDVSIELEDRVLAIAGVRTPVGTGETLRSERPYGSFTRTLTLPKGVDGDRIAADYHDGVLELHIPKPGDLKPKKIEIGGHGQKQLTS